MWAVLIIMALVSLMAVRPVTAAFTASSSNGSNALTAAATFPTYAASVTGNTPWAYHRGEDAVSSAATSTADDTTANNRDGIYNAKTNGPSLWWKLDDAGTTAADSSGSANPGTLVTGSSFSTGKYGGGVLAGGTTNSLQSSDQPIRADQSFTLAIWVYMTGATANTRAIANLTNGTGATNPRSDTALVFNPNGGANRWSFQMAQDPTSASSLDTLNSTTVPVLSTWTHLAAVYNTAVAGGTMYIYVNGALENSMTHTPLNNTVSGGRFELGRYRNGAWGAHFNGSYDDVRTYRRALSTTEIGQIAANTYTEAGMTAGLTGALQGSQQGETATTAVAFAGTANAYNNTQVAAPGPNTFTIECWFRASGTKGGSIIGYSLSKTNMANEANDRLIFIDNVGKINFFTWDTGPHALVTSSAYTDGAWHHVAASLGAAGAKLYVDGALVDSNAALTTGNNSSGYWRWGGSELIGFGNRPTSDYFVGTLDEVAIYSTQLTDQQIARHYYANH